MNTKNLRTISAQQIALGLAHCVAGTRFSHPASFVKDICDVTNGNDTLDFKELIELYINCLQEDDPRKEDGLVLLEFFLSDFDHKYLEFDAILGSMDRIVRLLPKHGFQTNPINVEIVEEFPEPYAGKEFSAMNYDKMDETLYGIAPKIVFKKAKLAPYYSTILFAHEIVHTIIGQVARPFLARGLEDGLADVVGSLFFAREVLPYHLCEQCLIGSRFHYPQSKLLSGYREAVFQALLLHREFGKESIFSILKMANLGGRDQIKQIECQLLTGGIESINLPQSAVDPQVSHSLNRFLSFPQTLSVSLGAYKLARLISKGMSRDEISKIEKEHNLGGCYNELLDDAFLMVDDGNKVTIDETTGLIDIRALRYII